MVHPISTRDSTEKESERIKVPEEQVKDKTDIKMSKKKVSAWV